jgi:hypothetical protein
MSSCYCWKCRQHEDECDCTLVSAAELGVARKSWEQVADALQVFEIEHHGDHEPIDTEALRVLLGVQNNDQP